MIPVIPWTITLVVIATDVGAAVAVWSILSSAAGRSGLSPKAQRRFRIGSAAFFGAWLGAALIFAPAPASVLHQDPLSVAPVIPLFLAASSASVLLALWRSPELRQVLAAVPLAARHAVQAYRTIGVVFLVLLAQRQLPEHFALPAGWGDMVVGVTAPLVGLALARKARGARAVAIAWNVFGLADLIVAVGMGTGLLAPFLAPQLGTPVPPAAAMGVFPMLLVPAFVVPLSVFLHLFALGGLLRGARMGSRLTPAAAG
jgi:hypothetical protein